MRLVKFIGKCLLAVVGVAALLWPITLFANTVGQRHTAFTVFNSGDDNKYIEWQSKQKPSTYTWWTQEGWPIITSHNHDLVLKICNQTDRRILGCAIWYSEKDSPKPLPHELQCLITIWLNPKDVTPYTPAEILTHEKRHCVEGAFHE